jgi:hypothetical protein
MIVGWMVLGGCETNHPADCVCTEQFVTVGVYILDADGRPVDNLRTTVFLPRTCDTLRYDGFPSADGYQPIADDRLTQSLRKEGERVRLELERDSLQFVRDYLIGTDPCRCHVEKWAGPDTLSLPR